MEGKNGMTFLQSRNGKMICLLSPKRKGNKYAAELRDNRRYTNSGKTKIAQNGKPLTLNKQQKAFRCGYLTARKDIGKAFKAKNKSNLPVVYIG